MPSRSRAIVFTLLVITLGAMALSLALTNRQAALQIALIDPKGRGLGPLSGLPHLLGPVATDLNSALARLERLVQTMERRDADGAAYPRIAIFVCGKDL